MNKNLLIIFSSLFLVGFSVVGVAANNDAKMALAEWRKNFLSQIRYGESSKRLERKFRDAIDEMEKALGDYHLGNSTREEAASRLYNCFCDAFDQGLNKVPAEFRDLIRRLKLECQADSQKLSPGNIDDISRSVHSRLQSHMQSAFKARAEALLDLWESKRHGTSASLFLNNYGGNSISGFFETMERMIEEIYVLFAEAL